jgi:UDP-glucose:glycoprotein glucosyltransferase
VDIELLLAPTIELTSMPLQTYYAYAMEAPPAAGHACGAAAHWAVGGQAARFARVPQDRVLTMNVDVPESWLVEVCALAAAQDQAVMPL